MNNLQEITHQFYSQISTLHPEYATATRNNTQIEKLLSAYEEQLSVGDYQRLREEITGYGPLMPLVEDGSITEILVNGHKEIWVEIQGNLQRLDSCFLSEISFKNVVNRIQAEIGSEANMNQPFIDGSWRGQRLHICIPPITSTINLSIRKKSKQPWDFDKLLSVGWCTEAQYKKLHEIYKNRKSFIIAGGTSSGKTSVLNSFLQLTANAERLVILEDTNEIVIPNQCSTRMLTRQDPQKLFSDINLQDLVKQSLRMRPDRIIMGEVRGLEAKDLLMAFATGHDGSGGTLHANSASEALLRLEMLIQLGAPQWSLDAVRRLLFLSLNYLVIVQKRVCGKRALEGIYQLTSLESFGITVEKII